MTEAEVGSWGVGEESENCPPAGGSRFLSQSVCVCSLLFLSLAMAGMLSPLRAQIKYHFLTEASADDLT